jgi:DNA-binding GntR family transcriptional regulator
MTTPMVPAARNRSIVRVSSGEQAARYIRQLIFDGELEPGERIAQDEIAKALGVSRIPLREALIALEREGWVTLEMHRGAFVNALDEQSVRDHYELFGLLYAYSAEKALARSGPELIERLAKIERQFREERDPVKAGRIVLTFHAAVIDAAHSARIKVLFRAMSTVVPGDIFEHVPKTIDVERKALPGILRAMRGGDSEKVAAEYARMMGRIGDEVVVVFRARGLFTVVTDVDTPREPAAP